MWKDEQKYKLNRCQTIFILLILLYLTYTLGNFVSQRLCITLPMSIFLNTITGPFTILGAAVFPRKCQ